MKCFSAQKADVDGFPVRSQLLWFYPASGETRAREAENAYGSINALIWPRFRFVNYSFRSGLKKKASRQVCFEIYSIFSRTG